VLRQRVSNVERLIRKLRSREAEKRRFHKGALGALRIAQPTTEKVPEQSGKADASNSAKAFGAARMGTRCWSGGDREALT